MKEVYEKRVASKTITTHFETACMMQSQWFYRHTKSERGAWMTDFTFRFKIQKREKKRREEKYSILSVVIFQRESPFKILQKDQVLFNRL